MTTDFHALGEGLSAAVPFIRTLGLVYDEISPERAVVRMPDRDDLHNHVGGPHAGAIFALGESASGAVVLANFADLMDRVTPLAAAADITYLAVARGAVTATATIDDDRAAVLQALEEGRTPKFTVTIAVADESRTRTSEMTVRWALRPNNR